MTKKKRLLHWPIFALTRPMVRSVLLCLVTLFFVAAAPLRCVAEEQVLDGIAAVVNGDVITFSQVRGGPGVRLT